LDEHATVTVCHKETKDLAQHLLNADIVVSAVGKAHVIKGEWIKKGAIVVDVGENMLDGKLVGDIEFETAKSRASYISPVPGGVGPLTNVMLIHNLVRLHNLKKALNGKH
jgi:methylenetetrahydrofolate dehydrogenase (NADP+)/methenyltetrahydrofolate cyclohydrolase